MMRPSALEIVAGDFAFAATTLAAFPVHSNAGGMTELLGIDTDSERRLIALMVLCPDPLAMH
jgi:hypothetical protein